LHDVTLQLFEQDLTFLMDSSQLFGTEEAVQFAEFYDQYEFTSGIALCDSLLLKYLSSDLEAGIHAMPSNLDLLVNAAAVAFQCNLPRAKVAAVNCMKARMHHDATSPFGPWIFRAHHIKTLLPVFQGGLSEKFVCPCCPMA
jgi:hypothetical protein